MAVDILNLGFKVDTADVKTASKDLDTLGTSAKKAGSSLGGMGSEAEKASKQSVNLAGSVSTLAKAYLSIEGIKAFAGIADEQTKYIAQLKMATSSTDEFNLALTKSQDIAKIAQTSIASVAMVYARFSNALKDSGSNQRQIGLITENVALALKASGAGAGETASAMLQLSQAFASGTLRGDEFNSMAENAPNLMRALAASMKVPVGELRALAAEGKITADQLLKAFGDEALNNKLRDQAEQIKTISGSWTNFWEQIKLVIAGFGEQSMITDLLTSSLNGLTSAMAKARELVPKEPIRNAEQQAALDEKNLEYLRKKGALGVREEERLKRVAALEEKIGTSFGNRIGGMRSVTPQSAPMPNFSATVAVVDTEKLHKQQEEAARKAKQAAEAAKEVEKANRELLTSIRELTDGERSNIQVLQDKLDNNDKITTSNRKLAQANLDLARSLEVQTAFQEAFNRGLENESDVLNRAIEETDAYAKAQSDAYTNIYQDLEKENEDLNAKLIINDKERGLKQLELEHQRKIAVIQNTVEIGAAQDDALRREDENYQKRIELLGKTQDGFMELKNAIEGFSRDASRALVDFAFGAEMTFSNMITSMLKELARLVIQRSIMDPIVNSISGAIGGAGGIGGLLGSAPMAAGGTGSGFMGWLSGILPARAVGGDVMANSPYIVGEKGKELFVPKTAGTIVPSGNIGGGTQVNNVSISITESGSKTEQGDSTKLAKQLEAAVVKVLIDQKRQGGVYA